AEVIGALFQSYNWDGDVTWRGVWSGLYGQFLNYWSVSVNQAYNPPTFSDRRTRGGPLMLNRPGYEFNVNVSSDSRKRIVVGAFGGRYHQTSDDYDAWAGVDVTYRPVPNLSVSVGPNFSWSREPGQFVTTYGDPTASATYDNRYVFADLDFREVAAGVRVNWTFSPTLSLQVYAQPLISAGEYRGPKALARPRTFDFDVYGTGGTTLEDSTTHYFVDADGAAGPAPRVRIDNPDFSFQSLRGNAVLRWEYLPGSTLFLVWTQSRSDDDGAGEFRLRRSWDRLLEATPDNIFMVKVSYWWNP
ncbi:MAG: DUF5916 domain-containing protein, partial [Gemmatimonadales bacterium]